MALLLLMAVFFLHAQVFPLLSLESIALYLLLTAAGAAAGFLLHRGGRLVRAIVAGVLVAVFLNHVIEWQLFQIRSRYSVPASFLLGFSLSWLLGRNLHVVGAAGAVAMLLATLLGPSEEATSRTVRTTAGVVDQVPPRPPPVLHVVFDGHIGVESLPADVPGSSEAGKLLRAFYAGQGFRLFGGAFSRNDWTRNALPDLMNFGTATRDSQLIRFGSGREYVLEKSEYFRRMAEFGYRIHVYQSDVMDFCTEDVATCTVVRYKSLNWIANSDLPLGDRFYVMGITFLNRSSIYGEAAWQYTKGRDRLAARTGIELPRISTLPRLYTPLSSLALAEGLTEAMPRFGPGDLVFAHLMLPHFPFALDPECRLRGGPDAWDAEPQHLQYGLYLEQVACATHVLAGLLAAVPPGTHVVVHGDHGARLLPSDADRFGTLFAVRRPNQPATYIAATTGVDTLLANELLRPLGVPVPALAMSGSMIKRMNGEHQPLRVDRYSIEVNAALGE